jgi:hypothetical protein
MVMCLVLISMDCMEDYFTEKSYLANLLNNTPK